MLSKAARTGGRVVLWRLARLSSRPAFVEQHRNTFLNFVSWRLTFSPQPPHWNAIRLWTHPDVARLSSPQYGQRIIFISLGSNERVVIGQPCACHSICMLLLHRWRHVVSVPWA